MDMVEGFMRMDKLEHWPILKQFQAVFNEPFVASTYTDQCCHWLKASQDAHDEALAGGRTVRGLWGPFARQVPLK